MNDSMSDSETYTGNDNPQVSRYKPIRVWPALLLLLGMAGAKSIPLLVEDESMLVMAASVLVPLILGICILIWWVAFSRTTVSERVVGFFGVLVVGVIVVLVMDPTMMGPGLVLIGIPLGTAAFGIAAVLFGRLLSFKRTVIAVLAAAIGLGYIALLRNDGMWGDGKLGLNWRWEKSPEEVMLTTREANSGTTGTSFSEAQFDNWLADPEWPQFRGPHANSKQYGPIVVTDWSAQEPELVWKIAVGPGWSSFAVSGNLLYTQEQHGEKETVVCYAADTGKEVWKQQINQRFFDALGGPGPRATPTIHDGMLFAQSAMGELQRLNPRTGELVWTKDIKEIAGREPPAWGFSSSPFVIGSNVIVHAGGSDDKGVLALDVETGELNWSAKAGDHSYSTPQRCTLAQQDCVLMLSNTGLNILDPVTGKQLLDYEWKFAGYRAVQPQLVDGNCILLPTQELGTRRICITASADNTAGEQEFTAAEEWTSRQLKPDFNDFVVFENHAYGFDGRIFTCINLKTGERQWKGGRYGKGQVLLLANSSLLLIVSESGEVLLLRADPSQRKELAKFQALTGRTWNHPVLIGDRLYIRNSQEAACYKLPLLTE